MKQVETDKKVLMQKSIDRACSRARFAGFLYFIGTVLMAVAVFFTLVGNISYVKGGNLNITTCWDAVVEVFSLGFSVIPIGMNFFVTLLYVFTVVHCVISALRALAKLDNLYRKGNNKIGYNQNVIAMEKLARRFSSSYLAIIYLMYFLHMFLGAMPTTLFYSVTAMFVVIHFWAAHVGAKASRFTVRDGVQEFPRTKGRLTPFVRNVMQFVLVGALMFFMSKANIINNMLFYFLGDNWVLLFGGFKAHFGTFIAYFVTPLLQLLICHFMLVIVVHACRATEWNQEGGKGKGMKVTRVFAFLIFLCALAFNALHLYMNLAHGAADVSMQMIYVAVIALAFFIMECCMAKLPGDKKKVVAAEPVEALEEEEPATKEEPVQEEGLQKLEVLPGKYKYVDAPAIYLQPNGQPIMVMPMLEAVEVEQPEEEAVAEEAAEEAVAEETAEQPEKKYATPIGSNALAKEEYKKALKAKWMARAKSNPEEEVEEKPLKKPVEADDNFVLGEDKKVKCPHCGELVWAKEGAPAYICPNCKEKFSF